MYLTAPCATAMSMRVATSSYIPDQYVGTSDELSFRGSCWQSESACPTNNSLGKPWQARSQHWAGPRAGQGEPHVKGTWRGRLLCGMSPFAWRYWYCAILSVYGLAKPSSLNAGRLYRPDYFHPGAIYSSIYSTHVSLSGYGTKMADLKGNCQTGTAMRTCCSKL